MTPEDIQAFIDAYPVLAPWVLGGAAVVFSVIVFLITRTFIARGLLYLAQRTKNQYDDILVEKLRPYRFAWLAPLLVIYYFASLVPDATELIRQIVLFLILWLVVITLNSLLDAANAIFEASHFYKGEPIQGYLDLLKIIILLGAIILTVSVFTKESPIVLLSGLGAITAVLLLIFRDTLLSLVASVQIQSNDLVKEGDWIEVPSYDADGDVINISLHTVTVRNFDMTLTMIPTYKLLETPYRNWRGMQESGARRIKRSIHIDVNSIRFCDPELIARLKQIDTIRDYLREREAEVEAWQQAHHASPDDPFEGRQLTNIGVFQAYVMAYLKSRTDLHQEGMTLLARQLAPSPTGLPLEVYVFAKSTGGEAYESTQADIFDHLLAALPQFDLRVFQEPTGLDFRAALRPEEASRPA